MSAIEKAISMLRRQSNDMARQWDADEEAECRSRQMHTVAKQAASELADLRAEVEALKAKLEEALLASSEMLASELTPCPPFEAGIDAQNAWADRRADARNRVSMIIDAARQREGGE